MKYLTVREALDLAQLACDPQEVAVRDFGLLSSALHRPRSEMFGVAAYPDLFEKAAALLQSLAVNHPLVDGNKRTAWMCTVVFLDLNGVDMAEVDQDAAYGLVIDVAAGKAEEVALVASALRSLHRDVS
ncbi:type II toxin-antitoxin system death-on-curing family toxin [Streptomyces radicis]|uniref:Type II toxin-antitoxin system death-on-curing family toxin n=1 Tax=Streptomyces radicis TaxID=1750517 RepID=A0A3A9WJB2_9ACTN|nr:type II toxin-antitoxin system death-on-curing family toxin [Streptomyces radicis]RKN07826.1 type II toxin-antitoxin system death-on-curing family toxin [Streptomyces radicis]RKN20719.1 type II toxin-antitoxin system death-on-curing family toxin [Streptomyces radicis]